MFRSAVLCRVLSCWACRIAYICGRAAPATRHLLPEDRVCFARNGLQTIAGRRRYLPDINSKSGQKRSAAERKAKNTVAQVGWGGCSAYMYFSTARSW